MTYMEKFLQERPGGRPAGCPSDYDYEPVYDCADVGCVACWNREIPEEPQGIKDSGNRTHFSTGAVRDMHDGKGRYDLLPWEAIHEVAKHTEAGAMKYGERNCENGIPIHSLIDSAFRHLSCYMQGMDDEKHLCAAAWNILFAIQTEMRLPEMQDIPQRKGR